MRKKLGHVTFAVHRQRKDGTVEPEIREKIDASDGVLPIPRIGNPFVLTARDENGDKFSFGSKVIDVIYGFDFTDANTVGYTIDLYVVLD